MKYDLNGLIEALQTLRGAPVHPDSPIQLGKGHVYVRVYNKEGDLRAINDEIELKDMGSFISIEMRLTR